MTRRIHPIITNQIYHIFNKGIAGQPIFSSIYDYQRFINLIDYYRFSSTDLRFSFYNRLPIERKQRFLEEMKMIKTTQVLIYAYCLMPNHFHLLVKEIESNGTRKFIANLQNSYAKYFNKKRKRNGSLFQEMFKIVRVENDEQFLHVARYIHLNPLTSYIIKKASDLNKYAWSSYPSYLGKPQNEFIEQSMLLNYYKNKEDLKSFTLDQADYQKKIHDLDYLTLERNYNFTDVSS